MEVVCHRGGWVGVQQGVLGWVGWREGNLPLWGGVEEWGGWIRVWVVSDVLVGVSARGVCVEVGECGGS